MYQLICAAELFQKSFAGVFLQLHHSSNQECLAHGANGHFLKLKKNSNLLKKNKKNLNSCLKALFRLLQTKQKPRLFYLFLTK